MKRRAIVPTFAVLAAHALCPLQMRAQEIPCSVYFGVLQEDAPGHHIARMSESQAKWYGKNGAKQYPSLCRALEKARYLIVWSVSTESRTVHAIETRTARVDTRTTGQESGTFSTYGDLSTWGSYSGTSSSSSTSTITHQESVPVALTAKHCSIYVLKSVGPTIWDDIRAKTPQPPVIFSTEARGPTNVPDTRDIGILLGADISHLVKREPTAHALNAALEFISTQPLLALPQQALSAPAASNAPTPGANGDFPKMWLSTSSPARYTVRFDGDYIYAEQILPDAQRPWIMFNKIDAQKGGKLYIGKMHYAGACRSTSCPFEDQIEFTLVTPKRIEGVMLSYPLDAKFTCEPCQFSGPQRIINFAWIPE